MLSTNTPEDERCLKPKRVSGDNPITDPQRISEVRQGRSQKLTKKQWKYQESMASNTIFNIIPLHLR